MNEDKIQVNSIDDNYNLEIFHLARLFYPNTNLKISHDQTIDHNKVTDTVEVE